jgi:hypothetical protein
MKNKNITKQQKKDIIKIKKTELKTNLIIHNHNYQISNKSNIQKMVHFKKFILYNFYKIIILDFT